MALIPKGGYKPEKYKNVPENSFSSADILRLMAKNITREERFHIMYFFCVIVPSTGFIVNILEILTLMFPPTKLVFKVLRILKLIGGIWDRLFPYETSLLMMMLPKETRKEASTLLKVLDKEYLLEEG